MKQPLFLPTTKFEMTRLNWPYLDILLITGDAYIDHPACGVAIIGRYLIDQGFKCGIIAQPDMNDPQALLEMGRPLVFCGITAGAMDSTLAKYTPFRKIRRDDPSSPTGLKNQRPQRAIINYANMAKRAFPRLPIVLGGLEASIRRFTHFDFMDNGLRRPILFDSRADYLVYGMGEKATAQLAKILANKPENTDIQDYNFPLPNGTCRIIPNDSSRIQDYILDNPVEFLQSHQELLDNKDQFTNFTQRIIMAAHQGNRFLIQPCDNRILICSPPATPLKTQELDKVYALPFNRLPHPKYKENIPAYIMLKNSITVHRGCAGGCSFCALSYHQGRHISSRSLDSVLGEIDKMTMGGKKRLSITDMGGPTANNYDSFCGGDWEKCGRFSCLYPKICPHFKVRQGNYAQLLLEAKGQKGVKNVRVSSGIRHDLALLDPDFIRILLKDFVGGQLKLAPEHSVKSVLDMMAKPDFENFIDFYEIFKKLSKKYGLEQYPILYLMSGHPGCNQKDMKALAQTMERLRFNPQQVTAFTPVPGTLSTACYFNQLSPFTSKISGPDLSNISKRIFVAKTDKEKSEQFFTVKKNRPG